MKPTNAIWLLIPIALAAVILFWTLIIAGIAHLIEEVL